MKQIERHIEGSDTCVVCGRDIPEDGKQYCAMCGKILTEDIPMPTDADAPIDYKEPCYMCNNARLDDELEDYNDFHSSTIGSFSQDCRIMLTSGSGRPLRIEIARWNDKIECWDDIGIYYPKYCPECGREIREYKNDSINKK